MATSSSSLTQRRKKRSLWLVLQARLIETLEAQIAEKESLLASGNAQDASFYAEYQSLKDRLDAQMEAWETATIAVDEFQNAG